MIRANPFFSASAFSAADSFTTGGESCVLELKSTPDPVEEEALFEAKFDSLQNEPGTVCEGPEAVRAHLKSLQQR